MYMRNTYAEGIDYEIMIHDPSMNYWNISERDQRTASDVGAWEAPGSGVQGPAWHVQCLCVQRQDQSRISKSF